MTYTDPTNVADATTSSTIDTQAAGAYTAVPQHVIIDGKDFLIVDASSNGVAIYEINPTDGSLIDPPTYLNWTQQAGENEGANFDEFQFYLSPDGTTVVGFDGDSTGAAAISYDIASGAWSVNYDADTVAGGIESNIFGFGTSQASDGTIYAYGSNGTDQNYYKFEWDWTTNSWTQVATFTGTDISAVTPSDNSNNLDLFVAPDGTTYMVSLSNSPAATNIYQIDSATGDIIPGSGVRIATNLTGASTNQLSPYNSGEVTFDENGNMVFSTKFGIQVIDPTTGTFVYQDLPGGVDGTTFYYGSDIIYGDDGYIYVIGRDGNGDINTKIYDIDVNGDWQFITQATDTTSDITWSGYVNGSYSESSNEVTTLSSGLNMIYTTQESSTGGPNTLIAAQVSTIGETATEVSIVCFVAGTMIETEEGMKAVETLEKGDMVRTKDNGCKPIVWIASRTTALGDEAERRFYPVRIQAGALGEGLPEKDLYVSQQHRVLVKSKIAQRMFGFDEVLVPALKLLGIEGIELATDCDEVTYVHFLFDQHEIVYSNGAESESLYTGPEAIKSVGLGAREEIFSLFPELKDMDYKAVSARIIPSGRMAKTLARRHIKNDMSLYSTH